MEGSSSCFVDFDGGTEEVFGFVGGGGSWSSDGEVGVGFLVSCWCRTCKGKALHVVCPLFHCGQVGIGVAGALWDRVS